MNCSHHHPAPAPAASQSAAGAAAAGALGNYTELRAACRGYEFSLHSTADRLTRSPSTDNPKGRTRLTACHHLPVSRRYGGTGVQVRQHLSEHGEHYSYGGLARCGQVWTCPLCAPIIAASRTAELSRGLEAAREKALIPVHVTLTVPHYRDESLSLVLGDLSTARQKMRASRAYKTLVRDLGQWGYVAATEVTFSDRNGWHPHYHEIWFLEQPPVDLESRLYDLWAVQVEKTGRGRPSRSHGCKVRIIGADDSELVSMSRYPVHGNDLVRAARELTSWHTKSGCFESVTPWDLLVGATEGDKRAAFLWQDFAAAFKGKAHIRWSRGLKSRLGLDDLTDEELLDGFESAHDEYAVERIDLNGYEWALVTRYRMRAALLDMARILGAHGVRILIDLLEQKATSELNSAKFQTPERWSYLGGGYYRDCLDGALVHHKFLFGEKSLPRNNYMRLS